MFGRRKPLTKMQTAKEMFWPSMGLKRSLVYLKHRILRVADSTHNIALGLAIGFGVSFTPLLGTHFIQAGVIAFILRGNIFAAMIGTFIGNPWTFPFFWWAGFSFGGFLFSFFGLNGDHQLPEHLNLSIIWEILNTEPLTLFLPWMLGGYILFAVSLVPTYFVYYYIITVAKKAKEQAVALRRLERKKLRELRKKLEGHKHDSGHRK